MPDSTRRLLMVLAACLLAPPAQAFVGEHQRHLVNPDVERRVKQALVLKRAKAIRQPEFRQLELEGKAPIDWLTKPDPRRLYEAKDGTYFLAPRPDVR
jgi:hypothetical protein